MSSVQTYYCDSVHVKLLKSLNDGNTVNQLQCQVIKDPEKNSGSSCTCTCIFVVHDMYCGLFAVSSLTDCAGVPGVPAADQCATAVPPLCCVPP